MADGAVGPLPDVLVIGAMKAATTGLCEWLDAQKGVTLAVPKEPGLFSTEMTEHERLCAAHAAYPVDDGTPTEDLRVDGSTDYAKFPAISGVPERAAAVVPNARIVYLMRHPVERAMSQFRFEWLLGGDRQDFSEAVAEHRELIDNGLYARQIEQWLGHFPREQICLVFSEAFVADPKREVGRVLRHIGASDASIAEPDRKVSNDSQTLVRPSLARRLLRESRFGAALRPWVPAWLIGRYRETLRRRSTPVMSPATLARMEEAFDRDLGRLRVMTQGPAITCDSWRELALTWQPSLSTKVG